MASERIWYYFFHNSLREAEGIPPEKREATEVWAVWIPEDVGEKPCWVFYAMCPCTDEEDEDCFCPPVMQFVDYIFG